MAVTGLGGGYGGPSLALDASDRPHIAYYYYDGTAGDLMYACKCIPLSGVNLSGPDRLPLGIDGLYTAAFTPPTATLPTLSWDNGTIGATASYSWSVTGTHSLAVTATNPCAEVRGSYTVTVFCQPPEGLEVVGPLALLAGQVGMYSGAVQPITTSPPITFTWDNGTVGPSTHYSWSLTGTYSLTVSATNVCSGSVVASMSVRVLAEWPYSMYLPLLMREE